MIAVHFVSRERMYSYEPWTSMKWMFAISGCLVFFLRGSTVIFDDRERKGLYGEGQGWLFHFLNKLEYLPAGSWWHIRTVGWDFPKPFWESDGNQSSCDSSLLLVGIFPDILIFSPSQDECVPSHVMEEGLWETQPGGAGCFAVAH